MFVTNSHGEKLLLSRLLQLSSQDKDKVAIVSHEGSSFELSKFTFNFISNLSLAQDVDKILTSISKDNLTNIIRFLSFQDNQDNSELIHVFQEDAMSLGINLDHLFKSSDSINENGPTKSQFEESAKSAEESLSAPFDGQTSINKLSTSEATHEALCDPDSAATGAIKVENLSESDSANEDTDKEDQNHKSINDICTYEATLEEYFESPTDDQLKCPIDSANEERDKSDKVHKKVKMPTMRTNPGSWIYEKYRLTIGDPEIVWDGFITRTIKCQLCGKSFVLENYSSNQSQKNAYVDHYQQHEMKETECGCEINFTSFKQRRNHWNIVHKGYVKCEDCTDTFSSNERLAAHMQSIHQLKKCDKCEFTTKRRNAALKKHNLQRHNANLSLKSTSFTCPDDECEKFFPTKGMANGHFNKVHTAKPCPECGKEFKNLQLHIQTIHSTTKRYQCDKCLKAFTNLSHLRNHELVDHQGVRYFCRYSDCQNNTEYRDPSNRSAHERKRHGGVFRAALPVNNE